MSYFMCDVQLAVNRNWQMALQQRSWLLHWALFVFFQKEGGLDLLLEFVLRESYVSPPLSAFPSTFRTWLHNVLTFWLASRGNGETSSFLAGSVR